MGKFIDLTGKRFNRLLVLERVENHITKGGNPKAQWLCKCDCGKEKIVKGCELRKKHSRSCGCYAREINSKRMTTHGKSSTRLYITWNNMKQRCYNAKNKEYKDYGGRGITVCEEWLDKENGFISFYNWSMSHGYQDNLEIDRIDNDKGYSSNNCRWATRKEQLNNYRKNHVITYQGQQYSIKQLSEKLNISERVLRYRIESNWNEEDLSLPPKFNNKIIRNKR